MLPPRRLLAALLLAACAGGDEGSFTNAAGFSGGGPGAPSQASTPPMDESASDTDGTAGETESMPTTAGPGGPDPSGPEEEATAPPPDPVCGNEILDGEFEECDLGNLGNKTCQDFGFEGGAIACAIDCTYDTSLCTNPGCGDGIVGADEECDCGDQGANCTAVQLGNASCKSLTSPAGSAYSGGTLSCNSPQACQFNEMECIYCGDGRQGGSEACDGGDLGGQTCVGLGFMGGSLSCTANCTYNTAGCMNMPQASCGDGACNVPQEDECTCPQDCPNDPMTCAPCECGGVSAACGCDVLCLFFGDCCANGPC
jgi:hypothetical protein